MKIENIFWTLILPMALTLAPKDLSELSADYFTYKDEGGVLTAFLCLEKQDEFEIMREIMNTSMLGIIVDPKRTVSGKVSVIDLLRYVHRYHYVVVDMRCEGSEELIMECSGQNMFNYSYAWLLIGDKNRVEKLMSTVNLSVDADVVIASEIEETMQLYDVFNTGSDRNGSLNSTFIGDWKRGRGIDVVPLQSRVYRRSNLTGITVRFAAGLPFIGDNDDYVRYLTSEQNRTVDSIGKINYALAAITRDFFNYTMQISVWKDYQKFVDGRMQGMLGALFRNEADFSIGSTVFLPDRVVQFKPVLQYMPFWTAFMFLHPKSKSTRNAFITPLATATWNAVIALSVIVVILLALASHFDRSAAENPWIYGFYLTASTLLQQGWSVMPESLSSRMMILTFLVFSMLLYDSYSAFLLSSILSEPPKTVRTLSDLYRTGMPAAIENVSAIAFLLSKSTDPAEQKMYKNRLLKDGKMRTMPRNEGVKRVKSGGFAYHFYPPTGYEEITATFTQSEICELMEVPFIKKQVLPCWSRNDNPYKDHHQVLFRRLQEAGILSREQKRFSARKPDCISATNTVKSIDLEDVGSVFLVLVVGIIVAIVILMIEVLQKQIVIKKFRQGKKRSLPHYNRPWNRSERRKADFAPFGFNH